MRALPVLLCLFIVATAVVAQEKPDPVRRVRDLEERLEKLEKKVATLEKQLSTLLKREAFRDYVSARLAAIDAETTGIQQAIENGGSEDTKELEAREEQLWAEYAQVAEFKSVAEAAGYLKERSERLSRMAEDFERRAKQAETEESKSQLSEQCEACKKERATIEALLADDSPEKAKPSGSVLWSMDMKSDLKGSGALADIDGDGKLEIVFGSYYGEQHVFCLDAASGEKRWEHASDGGPLDASIALCDIDGDKKLEALSADSGSGSLYCLGQDGKPKFTLKLPSGTDSPCAIADLDGNGSLELVVGTMWGGKGGGKNGRVCCYSLKDQSLLWQRDYPGCVQSEPVLVDLNGDKVLDVVTTSWRGDNGIHAFNGKDGEPLWTFTCEGNSKSMGMYHGVALSGDSNTIYAATCEGDVYALNLKGEKVWTKHYNDYLFSPITVADINADGDEDLVFGGSTIYALSAKDGAELWKQQLHGGLDRGAAVCDADGDGDQDVIFNDQRSVRALDGKSGEQSFEFDATFAGKQWEEISSGPIVGDFDGDGTLEYFLVIGVGTSDNEFKSNYGRAMAIRLKGKVGNWTTFRGNLRRTGNARQS